MASELLSKGLEISTRRRKWLVLLAAVGVSGYGAYKVYHMPYVVNKRRRLMKTLEAFICVMELVADSAETVGVVSRELNDFIQSDSDELPNSLKQIAKIARSQELSVSVTRLTEALTVGLLKGYHSYQLKEDQVDVSFPDRFMDKLMSKSGTGFVSAVVGCFARNMVLGLYSNESVATMANRAVGNNSSTNSADVPRWVTLVCDDRCRKVMADCIQTFVSTAVEVYLDKTMDMNVYDDLFKAMTRPSHQQDIRETLISVCNGAVETLVRTSHKVLTASSSVPDPSSSSFSTNADQYEDQSLTKEGCCVQLVSSNELHNSGWMRRVTSTLAVPSNRKLVLDVTGRVTSETVRSIVDFTLWKVSDGMKRSIDLAHGEVVGRGREALRYFSAKSSVVITVCLALYLHVLGTSKGLVFT
uniref:Protein PHLOEM PROTEIN 2-LIKE A10 n=1 Tax=Kalanchoe fedtschenkoi TaxID=63787 RepID=A0A7N0UX14_KALFE